MLRIASSLIPPRITKPVIIRFGKLINLRPYDINTDLNESVPYTTLTELEQIQVTEDVRHNLMVLDGNKYINLLSEKGKRRHAVYYLDVMDKSNNLQTDLEKYMSSELAVNESSRAAILSDLSNCTVYTRGMEDWDITHLAKQYQLQPESVFEALVEDAEPFGMGALSHQKRKASDFKQRVEYAIQNREKYVHVDYWNGIGVKSSFPVNIDDPETPLKLAIRRYNDRNADTGYRRIVKMLFQNTPNRVAEYRPLYPDQELKPMDDELESSSSLVTAQYKAEWDTEANACVQPVRPASEYDNAYYIWKYAMDAKEQGYYNHRHNVDNVWPYMMQALYEQYIKDQPAKYTSLAYLCNIRYNRVESIRIHGKQEFGKLSLVNMLIYGRVNVNMEILERILPLVRYTENRNMDIIQLDNYEIHHYMYSCPKSPRYKINWRDDNIPSLKFAKTDAEKLLVCKALARLMNEVPPELLNFNNYYHVCAWGHSHDLAVQNIDYLTTPDDN
jgi:hypothetical protein